ncbi:hypothetical protein [Aliikangiella maris]|uniref:Uncharacterized protein n=2 Tax=Aliikangiella maris TaxID=3162458 RepID=A0ABV2BWP8_9GAMM
MNIGLHTHMGYDKKVSQTIDEWLNDVAIQLGPNRTICLPERVSYEDSCTHWATKDNAALTDHVNQWNPEILVHSGLTWELIPENYLPSPKINGQEGSLVMLSRLSQQDGEQSAAKTLSRLTVDNIVAHPILLPEANKMVLSEYDMYGRKNRRSIALMGPCRIESSSGQCQINPEAEPSDFTIHPKDNFRYRVPAMFNIQRADLQSVVDNDFYPDYQASACEVMTQLTELRFFPLQSGTFEYQVAQWYKSYLASVLAASEYYDEQSGEIHLRIRYLLLGNETAAGVFIHPQIYARYLSTVKKMLHEIILEKNYRTIPKIVFGNWSNPYFVGTKNCLKPYFDQFKSEMAVIANEPQNLKQQAVRVDDLELQYQSLGTDAANQLDGYGQCLFEASSLDLYYSSSNVSIYDPYIYWYKNEVNQMCPGVEYFIKETGFSFAFYSESRHYNPQTQLHECHTDAPCLHDVNLPADNVAVDSRLSLTAVNINQHLRDMGFTRIAWFNHMRFGGEHGDVIVDDKIRTGHNAIENTRLGQALTQLDVPQFPDRANCDILTFSIKNRQAGELPILKWITNCDNSTSVQVKTTISAQVPENCDVSRALWDGNKSGERDISFMQGGYGENCPPVDEAVFWIELRVPHTNELLFRSHYQTANYQMRLVKP